MPHAPAADAPVGALFLFVPLARRPGRRRSLCLVPPAGGRDAAADARGHDGQQAAELRQRRGALSAPGRLALLLFWGRAGHPAQAQSLHAPGDERAGSHGRGAHRPVHPPRPDAVQGQTPEQRQHITNATRHSVAPSPGQACVRACVRACMHASCQAPWHSPCMHMDACIKRHTCMRTCR